jgi:hypothetical protein
MKGKLAEHVINKKLTEIQRAGRSQSIGGDRVYLSEDYMEANEDLAIRGGQAQNICFFLQELVYTELCFKKCYRYRSCRYNITSVMESREINLDKLFGRKKFNLPGYHNPV